MLTGGHALRSELMDKCGKKKCLGDYFYTKCLEKPVDGKLPAVLEEGDDAKVENLLSQVAKLNANEMDNYGMPMLSIAAIRRQNSAVRRLLEI